MSEIGRYEVISIVLIISGWIFLYFLSNRTFKRSETSKYKDRLVDKILIVNEWFVDKREEDGYPALLFEKILASKITQIEMRIMQYNDYIGFNSVDSKLILKLRDFEITQYDKTTFENEIFIFNEAIYDVVEHIEGSFSKYLKTNLFVDIWNTNKYTVLGALVGLLIVSTFFTAAYCSS